MASRPKCLRWTILIPSGPEAVDYLALEWQNGVVIERLGIQLLPLDSLQNLPDAKVAVIANGRVLFVELLSDGMAFGVDLVK